VGTRVVSTGFVFFGQTPLTGAVFEARIPSAA